ncbi:MAG: kynureninase, partial [Sneathiella sp.]
VVEDEWGTQLIRGWNTAGWYEMPARIGDKIATLIGAAKGEVVVCDSTSVNLYKAVSGALSLNPSRKKIISEAGNFPTDLYILDGISRFAASNPTIEIQPRENIIEAIDTDTAVVVLTHVHYVSGEIFPMQEITRKAHEMGALIVWDLSHSVGAAHTDLNEAQADFAVGCGYKHLNGGPGAPAFLFAAQRHHLGLQQPLSGWFSHKNPFEFVDDYLPADGIAKMLTGTTGVLGASALEASLDVMLETKTTERLAKTSKLSTIFQELVEDHCSGFDLTLASPALASERGAHISYRHPHAYPIMQNLIKRGVIGDFRSPDYIRLGFSPLFMSFENLFDAVQILAEILTTKSYLSSEFKTQNAVT